MKIWIKGDLELTLVALPGVFYTIRWSCYLYLPSQIIPKNSFEQILSHWKKSHTIEMIPYFQQYTMRIIYGFCRFLCVITFIIINLTYYILYILSTAIKLIF